MTEPAAGLLDTSIFIARETDRPLGELSDRVAVSVVDCKAAGVHRTVRLTDALIAATAIEHGLPIVTQDGDYTKLAAAHPALRVIEA